MSRIRTLLLVALLVAAFGGSASAQSYAVDAGSLILDGSAGFSSTGYSVDGESADERVTNLHASPSLQYFVRPGPALGGSVLLARNSMGDEAFTTLGFGPTVSYYFGGGERPVYPFVSGDVLYLHQDSDGDSHSELGWRAAAGALFMLSRSVGVNGSVYYQAQSTDEEVEFETDTFGVEFGFSAFTF